MSSNFITNQPISNEIGQIEHQTVMTTQGNIIDHNEDFPDVVDQTGLTLRPEDEKQLKEYIKSAVSFSNLVETFNDNAHDTLLKLLALQDNAHPLKKGGIGIAYRTDALIMHCKMEFSAEENIVFDAILGMMSTYPSNKYYQIKPSTFLNYSKYNNPKYIYKVFANGSKKLKERHLVFENLGSDGEDEITVPWFSILRYHKGRGKGKDDIDSAFIEFVPTDFFKDLALCSQIVHGAYGAIEVTTQLQGKYTIALYWFLENKKRYKEYPGAPEGLFELSLEEFKHQFNVPESYQPSDIKRRVLEPAKESINNVTECDFTFDYSLKKVAGVPAGYSFKVNVKHYIETNEKEAVTVHDPIFEQLKLFLSASGFMFSDVEIEKIYNQAQRLEKDMAYVMQIIVAFKQRLEDSSLDPVEDKVGYLCKMIEMGSKPIASHEKKTSSNNFLQNDIDFDALEQKLLEN